MISSIELQVLSKILTCDDPQVVDQLASFDEKFYSVFQPQAHFILEHYRTYNEAPDVFTFQAEFPDVTLVTVTEPLEWISQEMRKNRMHILLVETFNKLKDLGSGDVEDAWKYLSMQCEKIDSLDGSTPMDIVKEAIERSDKVLEYSKQTRIPTGFEEIDKLMYGGLSTVEELLLIVARTNTGKSWVCTKMMESAQKNGFPVLYYSPEMQASYLGTRFDTWRAHFSNSDLYQGKYSEEYFNYLRNLRKEETSAYVLEDKDAINGSVNVSGIRSLVKKLGIKLVIVDGLSYMEDDKKGESDYIRYKNICVDLFKLSKQFGCAVVVAMQANRETKDTKDDKGEAFPGLYQVEGSDHPGRICTQAFALRQIFDKHVLDIRLEKSRIANNQKPVLSYAWDVGTGNMRYLPGDDSDAISQVISSKVSVSSILGEYRGPEETNTVLDDVDEVEF